MKIEELERYERGRELHGKIEVAKQYIEKLEDSEYRVDRPRIYNGGLVTDFPFFDEDSFHEAHKEFVKQWVKEYLLTLQEQFEKL